MNSEGLSHDGLPYLLFTPRGGGGAARLPLILFLHGSGERGDSLEALARLTVHSLPGLAARDELPAPGGRPFPFLVACPQTAAPEGWEVELARLLALVELLVTARGADPRRLYLTGISMGAIGAWLLAAAAPDRFAALAPVSWRVPPAARPATAPPVWCFVGARDPHFTPAAVERDLYAARARDARTRLDVDPEGGHDGAYWNRVYGRAELYEWLLGRRLARGGHTTTARAAP